MRKLSLVAAAAAAFVAVPAMAQDMNTTTDTTAPAADTATAPDGTRAFGIEPYVAIMGGWEQFDRQSVAGIPAQPKGYNLDGALV